MAGLKAHRPEEDHRTVKRRPIHLRAPGDSTLQVDREAGIIRGASVIAAGPALGHGFEVDDVMLRQVARHALGGVRVGFTHGADDDLETRIGTLRSPRIDGGRVRGDIHFGSYSKSTPKGNLHDYLLALADEAPESLGLSIVFEPADFERRDGKSFGRVARLARVDFVGDPAANPRGLLSTPNEDPNVKVTKELRAALADRGLVSLEATDEEALAFVKSMIASAQGVGEGGDDGGSDGNMPTGGDGGAMSAGVKAGVALERKRVAHIRGVARQLQLGDGWAQQQIAGGFEIAAVNDNAIKTLEQRTMGGRFNPGDLHMTREPGDGLREAFIDSIGLKRGQKIDKPHARVRELQGRSLHEQWRYYLERSLGVDCTGLGAAALMKAACDPREFAKLSGGVVGHSTSDFPSILADSLNKTLRAEYMLRPATWRLWAAQKMAPDFKQVSRAMLADAPVPLLTAEGAEIQHCTIGDSREVYTLGTYTRQFAQTWQSLVNDDLGAFDGLERRLVLAARAIEDDLAYSPLTSNQVMTEDGVALFDTAHGNIITGTSADPPSVAQLGLMRQLLARQQGPGGNYLNLRAKAVLCPVGLLTAVEQLVVSLVDPAKQNDAANPDWIRALIPVGDPRLDANSVQKWYLVSGDIDTVEVCFLEDEPVPVVETDQAWDVLGVRYRVRHSVAARAIDYRGLARNDG